MSTTWYIEHLKCNVCQTLSPKDTVIGLSNKVSSEPGIYIVEKGQVLDIDIEDIASDFIRINEPNQSRVKCAEQNFAELVFFLRKKDAVMEHIRSVVLTSTYLNDINYLSESIDDWAGYFMDTPVFSSLEPPQEEIDQFKKALDQYNAKQK